MVMLILPEFYGIGAGGTKFPSPFMRFIEQWYLDGHGSLYVICRCGLKYIFGIGYFNYSIGIVHFLAMLIS